MNPNKKQKEIIESIEGINLVDAGPGTGKTFTITRRYINILENSGIGPEDIFLATFTNNAANEMRERIIQQSNVEPSELIDAPISTFHSYCQNLIELYGYESPNKIGLEEYITEDISTIESHLRETQYFERFYSQFKEDNSQYDEYYALVENSSDLLNLLKKLASRGIIPEKQGWFAQSDRHLEGDIEEFKHSLKKQNKPIKTEKGYKKQSELRRRTYNLKWKNFSENTPEVEDLRGEKGSKKVREDLVKKAFETDRKELKKFIHDIYFSYLEYSLQNNYLNFDFLLIFTYVLLHQNETVRNKESFEYLMIDEFQDTNEIQLKIAMLLARKPNICVVGDWKQSIYSFQHASIENILEFENRIKSYSQELNYGEKRIKYNIDDVNSINLDINYRSTKEIIETSEKSFQLPANNFESVNEPEIENYISKKEEGLSKICRIESEDELEAIVAKIEEIVDNPNYKLSDGRVPTFSDIAILSRTRSFGVQFQEFAEKYNVPASYEGGIELFRENPAIVLLAWLRITEHNSARGWAVVLEEAGYNIKEVKSILDNNDELEIPEEFKEFKQLLEHQDSIASFARKVFEKYNYTGPVPNKIIQVLQSVFLNTYFNRNEIIEFILDNIDQGEIYEIDNTRNEDSVNLMTIHGSKGLEFPIVFVADINRRKFPSTNSSSMPIDFNEVLGVRQRKILNVNGDGRPYIYDNWSSEVLFNVVSREYDEERRLMYVAMTRAEDHLFFTADKDNKSTFFSCLNVDKEDIVSEPEVLEEQDSSRDYFVV